MLKIIAFNLGSNIGNKEQYLNQATKQLITKLQLQSPKISSTYHSKAMLKENSPKEWNQDFQNISITAEINLIKHPPQSILKTIKQIEQNLGRINRGKWAPREIDIDILLIQDTKIQTPTLTIPHYDLNNRKFFTQTLTEILPNWQTLVKK